MTKQTHPLTLNGHRLNIDHLTGLLHCNLCDCTGFAGSEAIETPCPAPDSERNDFDSRFTPARVLSTTGWPDLKKPENYCPNNPKKHTGRNSHFMDDAARRLSPGKSGQQGEYLVTRICKYCGEAIIDCPTLYV